MLESSTGFRVDARAREVIAVPRSVGKRGLRTRACPLCAERSGGGHTLVSVHRRVGAASALGLALYAGAVAVCAFGAEWLWYHTDRLGSRDFALLTDALETWPFALPVLGLFTWILARALGGQLEIGAATCGLCAREERRARRRRVQLTVGVGAAASVLGVLGLWALDMPPLWALVVSMPVAVIAAHAAARLWPPALTWLGADKGSLILEVSPAFARVLSEEGRGAVHRAPRPRAGRLAAVSAVACVGLLAFLLTGDHPVCPPGTTPTRDARVGKVMRACVDDDGQLHGRLIHRDRYGRIERLGGASHGVASGWWLVDGAVVDGFEVETQRHELVNP